MTGPRTARLRSIDALRGASVAGMILVNSQFAREDAYRPFEHAEWNGWTLADTIFPTFMFLVGVSLALSTSSRLARGARPPDLLRHAFRRAALLYALGVLADLLIIPHHGFPWVLVRDHLQLTGVLQKIAVAYLAAFLVLVYSGTRRLVGAILALNAVYLVLLFAYPVPGCGPGVLTPDCNFPGWLDRRLIGGFLWDDPRQDRDGLGALLPAISTVLMGALAGRWLERAREPGRRIRGLLAGGALLVVAAGLLDRWVPVNKPLWTTTYALLMAGFSSLALAAAIALVDLRPPGPWVRPLETLGTNALASYLLSRPLTNLLRVHLGWASFHDTVLRRVAGPHGASMLFAIAALGLVWVATALLNRRGLYLKL
ncbi:MAG: heparan-alpha-glucosaminide N-acetyltransferase domain-containing protein [Anaeromyxobacteraceae bacterium]